MIARTLAALLVLALVGLRPAAAQGFKTVDTFTIEGAHGLIIIPGNWNGSLFIYAHGYSADARLLKPFPPDITRANIGSKVDTFFLVSSLVCSGEVGDCPAGDMCSLGPHHCR